MSKKYRSGFERIGRVYASKNARYAAAIIAIRENFTGFEIFDGYDPEHPELLTETQQKQVRRYYNTLTEYTEGGPVYKMEESELPEEIRQGGRKNIEKVMQAAQMRTGRKKSKFIFIRFDGDEIPEVKVRDNVPVFVNKKFGYEKEFIPLNHEALAIDAEAVIMGLSSITDGAKYFSIANGRYEFHNAANLKTLARKIKELQNKYAIGTKDSWTRWLTGVHAYYTDKGIKDTINYISKSKQKFKDRVKREQAKLRRKRK